MIFSASIVAQTLLLLVVISFVSFFDPVGTNYLSGDAFSIPPKSRYTLTRSHPLSDFEDGQNPSKYFEISPILIWRQCCKTFFLLYKRQKISSRAWEVFFRAGALLSSLRCQTQISLGIYPQIHISLKKYFKRQTF